MCVCTIYICIYIYTLIYVCIIYNVLYIFRNLSDWLTSCGLASPTMVIHQQNISESNSCSIHQAGCPSWSPADTGICDGSEGMDLPEKVRASRQRVQAFFFYVLYVGRQQKMGPRVKVISHLKDLD